MSLSNVEGDKGVNLYKYKCVGLRSRCAEIGCDAVTSSHGNDAADAVAIGRSAVGVVVDADGAIAAGAAVADDVVAAGQVSSSKPARCSSYAAAPALGTVRLLRRRRRRELDGHRSFQCWDSPLVGTAGGVVTLLGLRLRCIVRAIRMCRWRGITSLVFDMHLL